MNLLSQLRDIHYPPPISIWPLAFGWYVLAGILILFLASGIFLYYRHRSKTALRRMLLHKINFMREHANEHDVHLFEELSILLKRAALYAFPREKVASLYGEEWLKFLDESFRKENHFSRGAGRILATAPYQYRCQFQREEFFALIEAWIKKNL